MARVSPDLRRRGSEGAGGSAKEAETDGGCRSQALSWRARLNWLVWLLPVAVALVISAGAFYEFAGPPAAGRHVYVATQQMWLAVPVTGAGTTYDAYLARQEEDAAARTLATGGLLQSGTVDAEIAAQYAAERGREPPAGAGAGVPSTISSTNVGAALSATHTGNLVTLAARWQTADGARALLSAAVETLVRVGVPISAAAESGAGAPTVVLAQVAGPESGVALDSAVEAVALDTLLARLGFAVAAGLVMLAVVWVVVVRRGARRERG